MTTLAVNTPRAFGAGGYRNALPVIASDIIYEGAAVGQVAASGHARPLSGGDRFAGFAEAKADNSTGAAAAINVELVSEGEVQLSVSGAVITDVGLPVYATDDDTFVFSPVGASFIGFAKRFVSAGVMVVEFDVNELVDPLAGWTWEAFSANATADIQDNGKGFWVDTDAKVLQLAAVATPLYAVVMNGGAFGTIAVNVSPNASDKIQGPDIAGTDDHDLINTKATANRGDFIELVQGDANGPIVRRMKGIWATA